MTNRSVAIYLLLCLALSSVLCLNEVLNPLISAVQPAPACAARTASGNCNIANYPANYPCPCYASDGPGGAVTGTGQPAQANPDVNLFVDELVVGGLGNPVSVAFTDNTRKAFIGNKDGQIYWFDLQSKEKRLWIDLSDEVQNAGDKGLIGLTTAPNFATNPYVFATYVVDPIYGPPDEPPTQPTYQRLIRLTDNNGATNINTRIILMGNTPSDSIPLCSSTHMIGQVRFGRDGSLIVSAGDGGRWEFPDFGQNNFADDHLCEDLFGARSDIGNFRSQARWVGAGKILRIDPNTGRAICPGVGNYAVMNPFCTGNPDDWQSKIWAEGVRNPWRINIRPLLPGEQDDGGPGTIYFSEVGDNGFEEVNVVKNPGQNFGWPCWEGPLPQALIKGYPLADDPNSNPNRVDPKLNCHYVYQNIQTTTPFFTYSRWGPGTGAYGEMHYLGQGFLGNAAAGVAHYTGLLYPPQYRYTLWIADFAQRWIKVIEKTAQDTYVSIKNFYDFANPILSMEIEPIDGNVVYLNFAAGELHMIKYAPNNVPPAMKITASRTAGSVPFTVQFSCDGSVDRDNDRMEIWWDFGDGTQSYYPNPTKTYNNPGLYTVTLYGRATGAVGTATMVINANNSPPSPRITTPAAVNDIYVFDYKETLNFKATITGGTAPFTYKWVVNLVHLNHIHPDQYISNDPSPTVSVAAIGGDSHPIGTRVNFWLVLTVTDANGLVGTDNIFLSPNDPQANAPPVPSITVSSTSIRDVGQPISFSAQNTNDPNLDYVLYSWDFGDGMKVTWGLIDNPVLTTHTYSSPGTYTVKVTARDNFGATGTATTSVTISGVAIPPPNTNPPPPNTNPPPPATNPPPPTPPPAEVTFDLPARVNLKDFRNGGNNVAYYDTTPKNIPDQYRPDDGVDIEVCDDISGDYSIGYIEPGEWITYNINVPTATSYIVQVRYAYPDNMPTTATRTLSLYLDDSQTELATVTVPSTGGWTHWVTSPGVSSTNIPAGKHVLKVKFESGWWRVNWISLGSTTGNPPPPTITPPPPTNSQFITNLPGTLQAEDYMPGNQNEAYYDTTSENLGGSNYRPGTSVDIQTTGTITFLSYLEPNEWLKYSVNVASTALYNIAVRYAYPPGTSVKADRQIRLFLDDSTTPLATLTMPPTYSWDSWGLSSVVQTSAPISAGRHTITLRIDHSYWRLDSLNFEAVASSNSVTETMTDIQHYILNDVFIKSNAQDRVFNQYSGMLVSNYNNEETIGLVKINTNGIGDYVSSAKLRLQVTEIRGPAEISIFKLNNDNWNEDSATWGNIRSSINDSSEALATVVIDQPGQYDFDITSSVQIAQVESQSTVSFYLKASPSASDNRIVFSTKESQTPSLRPALAVVSAPKPVSITANAAFYVREGQDNLPVSEHSVVVESTPGALSQAQVTFNIFNLRPVSTYRLRMFGDFVGVGCMNIKCLAATSNDVVLYDQGTNTTVSRNNTYDYTLSNITICNGQPQWYEWDVSFHVRELLVKDALSATFKLEAVAEESTGHSYQAPKRVIFRGVAQDGYDPKLELDVDETSFVLRDDFDTQIYHTLNLDDLLSSGSQLLIDMMLLVLSLSVVLFL